MKRRSKNFKVKQTEEITFQSGSTDRDQLKSSYFIISGHFKVYDGIPKKTITNFIKGITNTITKHQPNELFDTRKILDVNIPESINDTGRGFVKIEYCFFHKRETNSDELTDVYDRLSEKILKENFEPLTDMETKCGSILPV